MTRTEAPKDLVGRGEVNLARTTPELPVVKSVSGLMRRVPEAIFGQHTVRPGDLAPDHADLGAADLLLAPVDVGDLLALIEAAQRSQSGCIFGI